MRAVQISSTTLNALTFSGLRVEVGGGLITLPACRASGALCRSGQACHARRKALPAGRPPLLPAVCRLHVRMQDAAPFTSSRCPFCRLQGSGRRAAADGGAAAAAARAGGAGAGRRSSVGWLIGFRRVHLLWERWRCYRCKLSQAMEMLAATLRAIDSVDAAVRKQNRCDAGEGWSESAAGRGHFITDPPCLIAKRFASLQLSNHQTLVLTSSSPAMCATPQPLASCEEGAAACLARGGGGGGLITFDRDSLLPAPNAATMGQYLAVPVTDKETLSGQHERLGTWGISAHQGWRKNMVRALNARAPAGARGRVQRP